MVLVVLVVFACVDGFGVFFVIFGRAHLEHPVPFPLISIRFVGV